jgi:hypothetical protein
MFLFWIELVLKKNSLTWRFAIGRKTRLEEIETVQTVHHLNQRLAEKGTL